MPVSFATVKTASKRHPLQLVACHAEECEIRVTLQQGLDQFGAMHVAGGLAHHQHDLLATVHDRSEKSRGRSKLSSNQ